MSRPNAKIFCFFENSQKTAGFSANGPPKARCSGQKPRHGRADTVFCLGAERGPRPLLFPGRLAQAPPLCIRRLLWALFSPPAAGKAFPSKGGSCAEKERTVCPRFPHAASEKRCPPPAAVPAWEQGAAHAAAALPLRKKGPCAFAHGPFWMRDASGHCARSIRQTMAEICPRVMVLAGLKVLVPLEK